MQIFNFVSNQILKFKKYRFVLHVVRGLLSQDLQYPYFSIMDFTIYFTMKKDLYVAYFRNAKKFHQIKRRYTFLGESKNIWLFATMRKKHF